MLGEWFTSLDFSSRMALISLSLGILLTLGVFLMARRMVGAPSEPVAQTPPANIEQAIRDPFVYGRADEKRGASRRRGTTASVLVSDATHESPPWHAIVADRSVGGLRLIQENAIAAGTVLSLRPGRATESTPWTQVEVRNCRRTPEGWELGCSFIRTPPSTIMLDFG